MLSASSDSWNTLGDAIETITQPMKPSRVVACIDAMSDAEKIVPFSVLAAEALNGELTLIRIIETASNQGRPTDPIASNLLRQEAALQLNRLAKKWARNADNTQAVVLEGRASDQICQWAQERQIDLTIICSSHDNPICAWDVGETARRVMDCVTSSVMIIPEKAAARTTILCSKIIAPLDGSSRAESALPIALRLAKSCNAELVVAHAVPQPEFTMTGPSQPEDEDLRRRILRRNEYAGRDYLNRLKPRLSDQGVSVRTRLLTGGDPRHLINRAILDENADMVVMSSHGHSGHVDVAAGSVASHFMTHTPIPLFIVRTTHATQFEKLGAAKNTSNCRFPFDNVA